MMGMLTSGQRSYLKALGHHLSPVLHVGHHGVTAQLAMECRRALDAHELIKVKFVENAPGERHALAEQLAGETEALVAQVIGRTCLLYRRREKDPTILLPRETHPKPSWGGDDR
jgi:RNA-binding protein